MFDGYVTSVYEGPVSDHFDGKRFLNQRPHDSAKLRHIVRRAFTTPIKGRHRYRHDEPGCPPPHATRAGDLRVTYINHATVLIQIDGQNILTDPVWSNRIGPVSWAGPKRVRPPGIRFEDLPPIDAVLVSHNHYDHMDLPTLVRLHHAHKPRFVVGLGNAAVLHAAGLTRVRELDWWDDSRLSRRVSVTSVPAHHFSARGLRDRDRTLWNGFVIETPHGAIYFAGDTGGGPHFCQVRNRFGCVRLAILPIGPFKPEWFMTRVHLSPWDAVRAHHALEARHSVAMHYGTFRLGDEDPDEAADVLQEAVGEEGNPCFHALRFGETRAIPV